MTRRTRSLLGLLLAMVLAAAGGWFVIAQSAQSATALADDGPATTTPIKHVVVIYGENESYDHYFGTYPNATNPAGEPAFHALAGTPASNNYVAHPDLLTSNPNLNNPARLDRSQALGCGNDHNYLDEQKAFDGGLMDKFVQYAGGSCGAKNMNYFDGNTVTALWNLAQHFTMSDAFFGTTFGPSTPGALNLISGNTHGALSNDSDGSGTIIGDPDPVDDCGSGADTVMTGQNVGDLLNANNVTWGWFQGGFRRTSVDGIGKASCADAHQNIGGATVTDYSAHHEPFQYYASTANPHHLPPTSAAMIGRTDQANHQYDLRDFQTALSQGNMPQVSFLKAASYQDGHPGYSDPIDEQNFIVQTINMIESSPEWDSTAIMVAYDDSDGWYDHVFAGSLGATINPSNTASDALNGTNTCGTSAPDPGAFLDRCGPGPRLPFLIVSPWVAPNTIHHTVREQTSILKFIEDNWSLGRITTPQSFDQRAATLTSMFDFNTSDARAPKVMLDALGQVAVNPPPPSGTFAPKVTCHGKRKGPKLKLSCALTGVTTPGTVTLKVSVLKRHKRVGTGSGTFGGGKVTIKVRNARMAHFSKGTYKLVMTVIQGADTKTLSAGLRLK